MISPAQVIKSYQEAVAAKDLSGLLALYCPDVLVYDVWQDFAYRGLAEFAPIMAAWFDELGQETVLVEVTELSVETSDHLAFASFVATYQRLNVAGQAYQSVQNRFTLCLLKVDDRWLIKHQHASLPID